MIDRARNGDKLMLRPALPQLFELLQAAIDDVLVAQARKRDAAAEPIFLL